MLCPIATIASRFHLQHNDNLDLGIGHRLGPYRGVSFVFNAFAELLGSPRMATSFNTSGDNTPNVMYWEDSPGQRRNLFSSLPAAGIGSGWGQYLVISHIDLTPEQHRMTQPIVAPGPMVDPQHPIRLFDDVVSITPERVITVHFAHGGIIQFRPTGQMTIWRPNGELLWNGTTGVDVPNVLDLTRIRRMVSPDRDEFIFNVANETFTRFYFRYTTHPDTN